jgi:hypothetical protein
MQPIEVSRWMLVGLGLLAVIGVAGCTTNSTPSPVVSGNGQTASPATATPAITPASSPTQASSAASTASSGIRNLVVSSAVRSELSATYVAYKGISPSDIAGTRPGSIYYAYDPATDRYWALATFEPSRTASLTVTVGFQDGGAIGLFTKIGTGTWHVVAGGIPTICGEVQFFPRAVLTAWSLPTDTTGVAC